MGFNNINITIRAVDAGLQFVKQDSTGGSVNSSTTETKLAEVHLDGGDVAEHVMMLITGVVKAGNEVENISTIKVYVGSDSDYTNNTVKHTRSVRAESTANLIEVDNEVAIQLFNNDQSWTGDVYITVTGKNGANDSKAVTKIYDLVILGK